MMIITIISSLVQFIIKVKFNLENLGGEGSTGLLIWAGRFTPV